MPTGFLSSVHDHASLIRRFLGEPLSHLRLGPGFLETGVRGARIAGL